MTEPMPEPRSWRRLAWLAVCWAPALSAAPLKLCVEDVPQAPWTMPDGAGLNIELLKRVERLTGEQFHYIARPWKRCEAEIDSSLDLGV